MAKPISVGLVTLCFPVAVPRFLMWGLQKAGCDVTVIAPGTGSFLPWRGGMHVDEKYIWYPDYVLPYSKEVMTNQISLKEVLDQVDKEFDLIIMTDPEYCLTGDASCPIVCFCVDNHVKKYDQREWDLLFGAHSQGFRSQDSNFRWLPCAYDPQLHFDMGLNRPLDVTMLGVMDGPVYQRRVEGMSNLMTSGFAITMGVGKVYEEYNLLYNLSKMSYVASSNKDLACRVFENMNMGCLVLADRVPDLEKIGFVDGVHYLGYDTMPELVEQARRGLDKDFREEMVKNAKEAVKEHTWEARGRQILKECGL